MIYCTVALNAPVRGFATPLAVMAARRDSKIVLLSFSGEAKVVPGQVFSVLRSVGLKVPGEVDALQRKPLRVVVRTLGRFGKVTGYEEPEFLECKGVKTGTRRVRLQLKSDIPSLWANGHRAHVAYPGQPRTCWRCGLEGHEARLCPNKRCSRCLQVGHTLAECKGDIVCNSCGKTGHLARLCPDRSYAARVATGVVEAVPVPAFQTVSPDAPLIAPVSDTSAPVEVFNSPSCSTSSLEEVAAPAETASLPTKAEQDKTAEMVLAEWHAEQDAACTGSPVATPAIGDTSRPSSQPAQETLSGPDSDSPMEDCLRLSSCG
ncbi:putative zinc finger CCHC domain-containing protein 3-like [Apostichopus japonicus]|uniref:Putative zinc finger CCHC domain-containing protein 3-like n=1 Tax=Stichopus japonicus TaxID=307972 RepID=A0A2G8L6C2_STIJA|nr:putative zinc finger CCHC domain-containing protein 3-like [Apostichopus japonicus]